MAAICAFAGERLIGAIPFERRSLALGNGLYIRALWATGVHVDQDFRSVGIGEAMDRLIPDVFGAEASGIFVYRGHKESGAYRWYEKIGFNVIATIDTLGKQVDQIPRGNVKCEVYSGEDIFSMIGSELYEIFIRENKKESGFRFRSSQYWCSSCKFHLYRQFYDYFVLKIGEDDLKAYAFIGQTSIGDAVERLDIFEFIAPLDIRDRLLQAIQSFALERRVHTLRFRTYNGSELGKWFREKGFSRQGDFFFMGKLFEKKSLFFRTGEVEYPGSKPNQGGLSKNSFMNSELILSSFSNKGAYFHSDYA